MSSIQKSGGSSILSRRRDWVETDFGRGQSMSEPTCRSGLLRRKQYIAARAAAVVRPKAAMGVAKITFAPSPEYTQHWISCRIFYHIRTAL